MSIARAGDQVILPRPHYFNHDMWMRMQGVEPVSLDFRPGSGGVPSAEDAERLITDRTRAIVLISPNNPTGAVYPVATIHAFYELAKPVMSSYAKASALMGSAGAGQLTKMVNQILIAGIVQGLSEGLNFAMKAGLDPDQVVAALGGGVAGSWILANRSAKMVKNEYPLGFRTSLHLKDLGIALAMAKELGVSLPVTGLAAQLETALVARGFGDEDMSTLARMIRGLSGMEGLD